MPYSERPFAAPSSAQATLNNSDNSNNAKLQGLFDESTPLLADFVQQRDALLSKYRSELRPNSVQEDLFVYEIAVADFRMKQLDRIEIGVIACQTRNTYKKTLGQEILQRFAARKMAADLDGTPSPAASELTEPDPVDLSDAGYGTVTAAMGAAWIDNPAIFAQLARQQAQARRDYNRALKNLKDLRTGKAGYLPEQKSENSQTKPAQTTAANAATSAPTAAASEKTRTNPVTTNYDLKWENPKPLFVNDPTLFDRLSQPATPKKNADDEIFTTRTGR